MKWMRLLLPALLLTSATVPAPAQFFRKPKVNNIQVPELIASSKSDPDERKRIAAVEQLREFDTRNYPDIVPVLVDVLLSDPKPSVRLEAVNSLSRLRPVSQLAGQALESAVHRDDNWRVRWQARTSLWGYQAAGYRGSGKDAQINPGGPTTKEPPLADGTTIIVSPPPAAGKPPAPATPLPGASGAPLAPMLIPSSPGGEIIMIPSGSRTPQATTTTLPRPLPSRPAPGFSTAVPQPRQAPSPPSEGPVVVPIQP